MRNLPMHLWRQLTSYSERVVFQSHALDGEEAPRGALTYGTWCKQLQRLAIGLIERGLQPGDRVGFVAKTSPEWISLAVATWLAGGCVVPIREGLSRGETLRALARSGCEVIVLSDLAALDALRGQNANLPQHLRWILAYQPEREASEAVIDTEALRELGRFRERRGGDKALAKRMYEVPLEQPSLILFDPHLTSDPHGAYFRGDRVALHLDALEQDFRFKAKRDEHEVIAVGMNLGWPHAFLSAMAVCRSGHTLALERGVEDLMSQLPKRRPTRLLLASTALEEQGQAWRSELERRQPEASQEERAPRRFSLLNAIDTLTQGAATRALHEPLKARFGDRLQIIHKVGPSLSEGVAELFLKLEIEVLSLHAYPEAGLTHMERAGATKRGSVGRPIFGVSAKIDGARSEGERGELLIRSESLSSGYWDEEGARRVEQGWLHTGDEAVMRSGFLYLAGDDVRAEVSKEQ